MNQLKRFVVWLGRLPYSLGFGIQSPTDYTFVREVINEHWQYYAYLELENLKGDWLNKKLGKLYFRLANWRQPAKMQDDEYAPYWHAGCKKIIFTENIDAVELIRVRIAEKDGSFFAHLFNMVDDQTVLIVEGICQNWERWHQIIGNQRVRVSFDLYYCGIIFFDSKRQKQHYIVNF